MQTTRDRDGLTTTTRVDLAPDLVLIVETSKSSRGIKTEAAAHRRDRGFLSHAWAICSRDPLESDFRRTLKVEQGRATQKALERQHVEALALAGGIEALSRDALAHQQARAARLSSQQAAHI